MLRHKVIALYKELLHLGREYPAGPSFFRARLHAAFAANAHLRDEAEIHRAIQKAEYVKREIEAL
ncbi:hypothetical protein ASPZODRAFT_14037 [Penicilliopsis zonata CBS 506.65]|uniref:Uncharacterized protein n=1 Tax=Penicilliopsis zonata CBS 506.65 TaxID=1073090 RepID=A0A1L9SQE2_9EURO|nr:hypothetical protein ASPZODRAFT_14037 [Penicilliopsis zonata CBS 506.65]OJJ49317.1 hypothetical protein ASPZODRAFT_14037 [Penicilliopsis zonata CBS 506.65]